AVAPESRRSKPKEEMKKVPTPGKTTCEEVAALLNLPLERTLKAIAVKSDDKFSLLLVRGDHSLNEIKAQKTLGEFRFATAAEIESALHCKPGYIGPVGSNVRLIA